SGSRAEVAQLTPDAPILPWLLLNKALPLEPGSRMAVVVTDDRSLSDVKASFQVEKGVDPVLGGGAASFRSPRHEPMIQLPGADSVMVFGRVDVMTERTYQIPLDSNTFSVQIELRPANPSETVVEQIGLFSASGVPLVVRYPTPGSRVLS